MALVALLARGKGETGASRRASVCVVVQTYKHGMARVEMVFDSTDSRCFVPCLDVVRCSFLARIFAESETWI